MAFMLYTITFLFLICATVLFATRDRWRPYAPAVPYITAPGPIPTPIYNAADTVSRWFDSFRYTRLPTSMTFAEDAEAGFHSANFNLAENIEASDSRVGLDDNAKKEIYRIMKIRKLGFDEARRLHTQERFGREGIAPDGRPLDRKAVMFS